MSPFRWSHGGQQGSSVYGSEVAWEGARLLEEALHLRDWRSLIAAHRCHHQKCSPGWAEYCFFYSAGGASEASAQ
eukprot:scaffold731_cov261-Pinguiococcus_pyrenoidosus.AAC.34